LELFFYGFNVITYTERLHNLIDSIDVSPAFIDLTDPDEVRDIVIEFIFYSLERLAVVVTWDALHLHRVLWEIVA